MTNIEIIDMANRSELAKFLARQKWCEDCALTSCGTKECADYIKAWMDKECEAEENPTSDNESQQETPTKKMTIRDRINALSNIELAGVLGCDIGMNCSLCIYKGKDCKDKSCTSGIKAWLEMECDEDD